MAGRAGRAGNAGRVLLQTHYPDHPLLNLLLESGYGDYANSLLAERAQTGMPPFGQLLLLRADCASLEQAEQFLRQLRKKPKLLHLVAVEK